MREWRGKSEKEGQECEKGREGKRARDTSIDFQCHLVVVSRGNITVVGSSVETNHRMATIPREKKDHPLFSAEKLPLPRSARACCLLMPLIDCPSVNSYRFNDVQRLIFVRGMVVQRSTRWRFDWIRRSGWKSFGITFSDFFGICEMLIRCSLTKVN